MNYTSKGRPVRMIIFTMDVTEMLSRWPESQQRRRALFDIEVCGRSMGMTGRADSFTH